MRRILAIARKEFIHIIRDPGEMARIRRYIAQNPARWANDSLRQACAAPGNGYTNEY